MRGWKAIPYVCFSLGAVAAGCGSSSNGADDGGANDGGASDSAVDAGLDGAPRDVHVHIIDGPMPIQFE